MSLLTPWGLFSIPLDDFVLGYGCTLLLVALTRGRHFDKEK